MILLWEIFKETLPLIFDNSSEESQQLPIKHLSLNDVTSWCYYQDKLPHFLNSKMHNFPTL